MDSFSNFIKDQKGSATPRKVVDTAVHAPVYVDDLNESMLKGVWKMLPQAHTMTGEEDAEEIPQVPKVDQARQLFKQIFQQSGGNREAIVNAFITRVGVSKKSTAVNYYERFMREFGVDDPEAMQTKKNAMDAEGGDGSGGAGTMGPGGSGMGGDASTNPNSMANMEPAPESDDPDRQGIIRTIDNAHLVYKRTSEDSTYEELWIYNINDQMKDELVIRRAILSGTDIEPGKTRSTDGTQKYSSWTIGNAQMLEITGLPN